MADGHFPPLARAGALVTPAAASSALWEACTRDRAVGGEPERALPGPGCLGVSLGRACPPSSESVRRKRDSETRAARRRPRGASSRRARAHTYTKMRATDADGDPRRRPPPPPRLVLSLSAPSFCVPAAGGSQCDAGLVPTRRAHSPGPSEPHKATPPPPGFCAHGAGLRMGPTVRGLLSTPPSHP